MLGHYAERGGVGGGGGRCVCHTRDLLLYKSSALGRPGTTKDSLSSVLEAMGQVEGAGFAVWY